MDDQDSLLARPKAAPLFQSDWLDERCYVCARIANEGIASPLGDVGVRRFLPTLPDYMCVRHRARDEARKHVWRTMADMERQGVSRRDIASYYDQGYLGLVWSMLARNSAEAERHEQNNTTPSEE